MLNKIKTGLFSIRHKIIFVVSLSTLFTAIAISSLYYYKIKHQTIQTEIQNTYIETGLIAPLILSQFQALQDDITALYKTAPVKGIMRAHQNHGTDPKGGNSQKQWKKELTTIFESVLAHNKSYVQVRYIGIADNGRELIRVDRTDGEIIETPITHLQEKGQEPYFQDALNLKNGEIYLSAINLNREHGQIQVPHLPVVRIIRPVYDDQEKMFGMLIINASYKETLTHLIKNLHINKDIIIVNENGDYLMHKAGSEEWDMSMASADQDTGEHPLIDHLKNVNADSGTFSFEHNGQNNISQYIKINYAPDTSERFLMIALITPESRFLNATNQVKREVIFLGFILVIGSGLLALALSMVIITPIEQIINGIRAHDENLENDDFTLPTQAKDEIGELARTYKNMMVHLSDARKKQQDLIARMQAIMDQTVDGFITIDEMGNIESFNKACTQIFGYNAQDVIGKNVKILMPDPYHSEHDQYLKNYKNTGQKKIIGIGREVSGKTKDGQIFPIELSVSEVNVNDRRFFSGIVRDITQRKEAETALLEANAELEEFAYRTSHDLKSPLVSTIGLLEVIENAIKTDDQNTAARGIEHAQNSLKKLEKLVKDILTLTQTKYVDAPLRSVDITKTIDNTLKDLSHMENFERLDIRTEYSFSDKINTQKDRLILIVQNLISNAIKYQDLTKENSFLNISTIQDKNALILTVEDNGIGIPKERKDQLFQMFKRFHPKVSFGSGLGLYMIKKSADLLGGTIAYENTGNGSRFTLTIPL